MVERIVCSSDETSANGGGGGNSSSSSSVKSSSVGAVVTSTRDDGFVLLGTGNADNERRTRGYRVVLEPEVRATSLESSRLDTSFNRGSSGSGGIGGGGGGGGCGGSSVSSGGSSSATGRFSLFKWFKRGSRDSTSSSSSSSTFRRRKRANGAVAEGHGGEEEEEEEEDADVEVIRFSGASSTESVDTVHSTATVRSFDFHSGTLKSGNGDDPTNHRGTTSLDLLDHTQRKVGPFGAGAVKIVAKPACQRSSRDLGDVARTLPANALARRRDITARYSLQPCAGFGSCGNFRGVATSPRRSDDRGTGGRVHVRGKRRAPNPPGPAVRSKPGAEETKTSRGGGGGSGRKKRRPAPKPPERNSGVPEVRVENRDAEVSRPDIDVPRCEDDRSEKVEAVKSVVEIQTQEKLTLVTLDPKLKRSAEPDDKAVTEAESAGALQGHVCTKNDEVRTNPFAEVSSKGENQDEGAGESPRIRNDTLVLQGGVLHSKKEARGTEADSAAPQGIASKDDEATLNILAEASSRIDNEESRESSQSISNDTLVLQGGVLHSKRETRSTTLTSGTTNVPGATSSARDTSGSTRQAITTGSQTSSAMPRPWYKRSVFEHSRDSGAARRGDVLRNPADAKDAGTLGVVGSQSSASASSSSSSPKSRRAEKSHEGGEKNSTLSRLNFFHRSEKTTEERRKENKRKSGLSILTNISELDKEAAAIVQEEQARTRAASMLLRASRLDDEERRSDHGNEEVVQDIVTSAMSAGESSPRRGTRALISKFNAIGNVTRVTVNSSFFAKSSYAKDHKDERVEGGAMNSGFLRRDDRREATKFKGHERSREVRVDKDLSRYFLPRQSSPKTGTSAVIEGKVAATESPKTSRAAAQISTRLSFLQGAVSSSRSDEKVIAPGDEDKRNDSHENSPKLSRLRVRVANGEAGPASRGDVDEVKKGAKVDVVEDAATRRNAEVARKEFASIFSKIDEQLASKEFQGDFKDKEKRQDTGTSSRVSKVLDILVEAEKGDRLRSNQARSRVTEVMTSGFTETPDKPGKSRNSVLTSEENPATTDLREMLKEMKHSLPKRPKLKKPAADREAPADSEKTRPDETKPDAKPVDAKRNAYPMNSVTVIYPPPIRIGPPADVKTNPLMELKTNLTREVKTNSPMKLRTNQSTELKTNPPIGLKMNPMMELKTNRLTDLKTSPLLELKTNRPTELKTNPPTELKTNPPTELKTANEERDYEKAKVSSAAQTCGNVRWVTARPSGAATESPKWRKDDVVYRTSGKGFATPGTSGLVKNTFQLIRPREFAQIEAVKTTRNLRGENTYANVVERESLYANAPVTAPRKISPGLPTPPKRDETMKASPLMGDRRRSNDKVSVASAESNDDAQEPRSAVDQQNMNTLAVNRLLRKLEAAIASGHHQQAAGLAKELARLKIHCSVVRQRTRAKDVINVNLYIEDKLAHQGPIPLRLAPSMTVAQLKTKVFTEFEIPTNVQRWIVGKNLADDDATTLEELQAVEGSTVFLYLVAPEIKVEEPPERVEKKEEIRQKETEPKLVEEIATLALPEKDEEDEEEEEEEEAEEQAEPEIAKDEEEEDESITEEARMKGYEALISLENCDVIPNSEPIECPICFVTYGPQEGVILRDCLHMFCRPCIANTIRYCEEAEVKCPYRDTEYTCESTLQEREIKSLVETEVYQQHLAKSIAQAENNAGNNAFHCKTPDCPGWCIYDDNVNNFLCPVCGVNNCLTCQVVHTGKNCRQYQQELRFSKETDQESKRTAAMLEEMVDRGEALPCPTCAVVLMKKWGCDWLRCSMCKTEICWVTRGPRWGPGGKGDTSGGCRCGENGVKCHPRCNYCH